MAAVAANALNALPMTITGAITMTCTGTTAAVTERTTKKTVVSTGAAMGDADNLAAQRDGNAETHITRATKKAIAAGAM